MIYFTAHTFKCVCHCRRAMFRVLGMYNFDICINLTKHGFELHGFFLEPKSAYLEALLYFKTVQAPCRHGDMWTWPHQVLAAIF